MDIDEIQKAEALLRLFKGDDYAFGKGALEKSGSFSARLGKRVVIISGGQAKRSGVLDIVVDSIKKQNQIVTATFDGARPNAPREDVYRLAYQLSRLKFDVAVTIGGGSCIDASKAALALATCGGVIGDYFGTGKVSEKSGGEQLPLVAVQTASSSASHLTKYSNVTDIINHQKKLIVDKAIVPKTSVFQYDVTRTMPTSLTKDGGLDGISHCWEVWMGATGKDYYNKIGDVAYLGIQLIVHNLLKAVKDGNDLQARHALGLGTDLGGYSIMIGGTNAAHLGSFSLVDILSHGRACAILNPYYTLLFSSVIQDQLRRVSKVYQEAGSIIRNVKKLSGRQLGIAVAEGMIEFSRSIRFPTTLKEAGATEEHIQKMLNSAKDPQLRMKLKNMPIPMKVVAGDIDKLMKPTLEAAYTGELDLIPDLTQQKAN